jgi:hypothetical protein
MKRVTRVLVVGREAYEVSCSEGVICDSADAIVEGLRLGHVKLMGSGIVEGEAVRQFKDMTGAKRHFPNKAKKLNLINIEKRHAFAKLADIMPSQLKASSSDAQWHEERIIIDCFNCHTGIPGKRRIKGNQTQIFQPDSKDVTHIGKRWYCGCTTHPPIPKHQHPAKVSKKDLFPFMKGGGVVSNNEVIVTVTFSGPVDAVKKAIKNWEVSHA